MLGKHLLGIYEKALPGGRSWRDTCKMASELGFDFVELSIDETDERIARLYWSAEERRVFREAVYDSGMNLQTLCLSAHRRFPFGSADRKTREKAREIMERAISFACEFGVRAIQLAGYDVYYEASTPESLDAFREGLAWACDAAAKAQVMLSMEIMDTKLMSSVSRYLEFSRFLNSPWFTMYLDIGNLSGWRENDVMRELELGLGEMIAVHIKDSIRETETTPGVFKRVDFGTGCVDFQRIFGKLEHLGYAGPYTIEMWCGEHGDAAQVLRGAKVFVEEQFRLGVEV